MVSASSQMSARKCLRPFVQVLAHGDEFILQFHLVGCQGMGGHHRPLVKQGTGADMVKMFVGQNDEVNIVGRQAHIRQTGR